MSTRTRQIALILAIVLLFGPGAAYAQNNGNGNGPGNGNQNRFGQSDDPQGHAYRHGGMGFVNAQNGNGWNAGQRGQMGRGAGENGAGFYTALPPATVETLPDEVVALMIDGWLDEQTALATYGSILGQFGEVRPFSNIIRAEAQHAAAWEFLFDRYGIDVPTLPGVEAPQFASVADACAAGAQAEINNFGLYDEMLVTFADYPDVYQVALALRNASEFNHLPAFERCGGA